MKIDDQPSILEQSDAIRQQQSLPQIVRDKDDRLLQTVSEERETPSASPIA